MSTRSSLADTSWTDCSNPAKRKLVRASDWPTTARILPSKRSKSSCVLEKFQTQLRQTEKCSPVRPMLQRHRTMKTHSPYRAVELALCVALVCWVGLMASTSAMSGFGLFSVIAVASPRIPPLQHQSKNTTTNAERQLNERREMKP